MRSYCECRMHVVCMFVCSFYVHHASGSIGCFGHSYLMREALLVLSSAGQEKGNKALARPVLYWPYAEIDERHQHIAGHHQLVLLNPSQENGTLHGIQCIAGF